jgi:hypothetical protein
MSSSSSLWTSCQHTQTDVSHVREEWQIEEGGQHVEHAHLGMLYVFEEKGDGEEVKHVRVLPVRWMVGLLGTKKE